MDLENDKPLPKLEILSLLTGIVIIIIGLLLPEPVSIIFILSGGGFAIFSFRKFGPLLLEGIRYFQ